MFELMEDHSEEATIKVIGVVAVVVMLLNIWFHKRLKE